MLASIRLRVQIHRFAICLRALTPSRTPSLMTFSRPTDALPGTQCAEMVCYGYGESARDEECEDGGGNEGRPNLRFGGCVLWPDRLLTRIDVIDVIETLMSCCGVVVVVSLLECGQPH